MIQEVCWLIGATVGAYIADTILDD